MNDSLEKGASLGEKLAHTLTFKPVFSFDLFGYPIVLTETVIVSWVIIFMLTIFCVLAGRKLKIKPGKFQVALEYFIGSLNTFFEEKMGHHFKVFAPFLLSIALYLVFANMVSIFSPISAFGFEAPFEIKPPTRDINVTAAYAVTIILVVLFSAIRYKSPIGWIKSLVKPSPIMLPFNLLEYIIRPLSLALRLFGNILGAFVIMKLLEIAFPVFVPSIASLYFDLFDGCIQAIIFVFLSTMYISEAVE